jgi:type IV secretion system protein VirB5
MRIFRNKRQAALSTAPGMYAEEDPSKVVYETSTRLKVESNRWMLIAFACLGVAAGAV